MQSVSFRATFDHDNVFALLGIAPDGNTDLVAYEKNNPKQLSVIEDTPAMQKRCVELEQKAIFLRESIRENAKDASSAPLSMA